MLMKSEQAESKTEKDLGVVVDSMMKMLIQYMIAVTKRGIS